MEDLLTNERFVWRGRRNFVMLDPNSRPAHIFRVRRQIDDALTGRFKLVSYVKPESSTYEVVGAFLKHYAGNLNPWNLLVIGDPNPYQVAHVANTPAMLFATFILVLFGFWLVARFHRNDAWWRFVLFGLASSLVPASRFQRSEAM